MTMIDTPHATAQAGLVSPFALAAPLPSAASPAGGTAPHPSESSFVRSPFTEGLSASAETDDWLGEYLAAELEDEDFTEALAALGHELARLQSTSPVLWNGETGMATVDPTEAVEWMEALADRTDHLLAELETRFAERSVESLGEEEFEQTIASLMPSSQMTGTGLDAQEMWFSGLRNKLKKAVGAVRSAAKKGLSLASRFLPLGIILRKLRPIIRPLLNRVLARNIGKFPKQLQEPARRLAAKFGLKPASEFETEADFLAAGFDAAAAEALMADDSALSSARTEDEAESWADRNGPDVVAELDAARQHLVDELLASDPGEEPLAAMENFLPVALLPIAKMGVKLAGRGKIVDFIANLLAKLVAPVTGPQLARPLSSMIADQGLKLIGLEAEARDEERLGGEAVVAAVEDTLHEVMARPQSWLENEALLEATVLEAFEQAVTRHFPAGALRSDLSDGEEGAGVWTALPRDGRRAYRYRRYTPTRVRLSRSQARQVVFSGGETLEERLEGQSAPTWPAEVELEVYELLPGADIGHLTSGEAADPGPEGALEFDELQMEGPLPLPAGAASGRKQIVRMTSRGRPLRRRPGFSLRLDLSGSHPQVRIHLLLGERQAHRLQEPLQRQATSEALRRLTRMAGPEVRRAAARRFSTMLQRRRISADDASASRVVEALFDALMASLGTNLSSLAGRLVEAARAPEPGVTITAVYTFASRNDLLSGAPGSPTLQVRAGMHRD